MLAPPGIGEVVGAVDAGVGMGGIVIINDSRNDVIDELINNGLDPNTNAQWDEHGERCGLHNQRNP